MSQQYMSIRDSIHMKFSRTGYEKDDLSIQVTA